MPTARQVIESFYEKLAQGDMPGVLGLYAPDVVYTVIGSTPVSGRFRGMDELREKLFIPVFQRVKDLELRPQEIIADGDRVAVTAQGRAKSADGRPYDNTYCFVFKLRDGRIAEVTEYLDTALVETALYGKTIA